MSGKAWEKTKSRVRKAIKKLAVDLLNCMQRDHSKQGLPTQDMPWQEELRTFPYQATTDQAVQDKARYGERSPDGSPRLWRCRLCKTEVAIEPFSKPSLRKQVALCPYHFLPSSTTTP